MLLAGLFWTSGAVAQDAPPKSLDPRVKVELFAEHPQIVTPTGIDVDSRGRVWAVESNTHFPPKDYKGHPTDRVLVMSDTDGDGKADRIVVFTDGLRFTMSVAVKPVWAITPASGGRQPPGGTKPTDAKSATKNENKDSANESGSDVQTHQGADAPRSPCSVYIATRREIRLFHDDDGDDKADRSERIVELDTKGDYPHNGLAGFAFDALGWMYFGCGENLGADYKLIGSDGVTFSGGGEGGSIYRCRLDGMKLERVATGFWNPHANCFDAFGRLFSVDNDPDSRPPCRLLHIIPGGDYGYRFRNGRAGLHPFTSWNGEIPGTLPMVAGTGEAPSGILAYESDGLPEDYIGNLFATSWGDHRIDRFRLKPRGASFGSVAEPLIVGGENFRPVGIACAPDGSLYFTDWVKRDYNLHGHGRVWRISAAKSEIRSLVDIASISAAQPVAELVRRLKSPRIDIRRMSAAALSRTEAGRRTLAHVAGDRNQQETKRSRIEALWAIANSPVEGKPLADEVPDLWSILLSFNEVSQAAYRLVGSAQFPIESFRKCNPNLSRDQAARSSSNVERSDSDSSATLLAMLPLDWELAKNIRLNEMYGWLAVEPGEDDPFLFAGAVNALAAAPLDGDDLLLPFLSRSDKENDLGKIRHPKLAALLAIRRISNGKKPDEKLQQVLKAAIQDQDEDEAFRRAAVQWVAEEHLSDLRPQVEAVLNDSRITADLFLATLAGLEMLDGVPPAQFDKTPPGKYVLPLVRDEKRGPTVRALALRLVNPADPALDGALLEKLLQTDDPKLRLETVRTLQSSPVSQAPALLQAIAGDEKQDKLLRAEAIAGLGSAAGRGQLTADAKKLLLDLLKADEAALRSEALRSLRGIVAKDPEVREAVEKLGKTPAGAEGGLAEEVALALGKPPAGLRRPLAGENLGGGDAATGRRVFFHANAAGCFKCHTVDGRGGRVGPDLSTIGRSHSREKLLVSIVEPGKEIAPQYVAWTFETTDGKVLTGMIVHENEGKTIIGDADGKLTELKTIDIVQRVPQAKSVMPDKLPNLMTLQEFRDLLAFLESLK